MAFPFKKFHTSLEVWNKYGTRKGAWIGLLPYLPHLAPPAYIRAGVRVCVVIYYGMEGMEEWLQYWVSAFHTCSIPQCRYGTPSIYRRFEWIAGMGLYGLVADGEMRAEVYAAAPLALDTLVPTPSGWTTQGELNVGDKVFDESGKVCSVTYLSPILKDRECFEIEFDDGTIVVSDANHLWSTIDTRGQTPRHYESKVVTTKQISESLISPSRYLSFFIING